MLLIPFREEHFQRRIRIGLHWRPRSRLEPFLMWNMLFVIDKVFARVLYVWAIHCVTWDDDAKWKRLRCCENISIFILAEYLSSATCVVELCSIGTVNVTFLHQTYAIDNRYPFNFETKYVLLFSSVSMTSDWLIVLRSKFCWAVLPAPKLNGHWNHLC